MKKNLLVTFVILLSFVVLGGCSKGYESQKNSGGMNIALKAENYPLVKGDNVMSIKVTDASGAPVTDAKVDVRFYMPPMPGMAPMDFTTQAVLKGDKYAFTGNAPMEGGWKAEVTVAAPGKQPATTTFNLDAR